MNREIEPEHLNRIGGRGLLLIRTFMDQVTFNKTGNQITMLKCGSTPGFPALSRQTATPSTLNFIVPAHQGVEAIPINGDESSL
jgi:hypothetical protein